MISNFNFENNLEDIIDRPKILNDHLNKDDIHNISNINSNKNLIKGTRGPNVTTSGMPQIETSTHGGSWLDSFENDGGVDWTHSDHIVLSEDSIIMLPTQPKTATHTVALWHFDEGSGTTTYDDTSNDNDGILGGDGLGTDLPTWTIGIIGNALEFDGFDDHVMVPHSASLFISDDITVSAWINKNGTKTNNIIIKFDPWSTEFFWIFASEFVYFRVQNEGSVGRTLSSKTIVANTGWHNVVGTRNKTEGKIRLYVDGQLEDEADDIGKNISNQRVIKIGKYAGGSAMPYNGKIDEVTISNHSLLPTNRMANLTTKTINLPSNMHWDTLIINKSQPKNSTLNIKILNASNNQQIPGIPIFTNDGEFDISYIDSEKYPSIKLNATFTGNNWGLTPKLNYWGVSWNASNTFRDTFFEGIKNENKTNINVSNGLVKFNNSGYIISTPINISNYYWYNSLLINKSHPLNSNLNITLLDGITNTPIKGYINLTGTKIALLKINPKIHFSIKLKAEYSSSLGQFGILNSWSLNWSMNTPPIIKSINSALKVNRTHSEKIEIDLVDFEEPWENLTLYVNYKSPIDSTWQSAFLSDPFFKSNIWECNFTPSIIAELGNYNFRFKYNDSFGEEYLYPNSYQIEVVNNAPCIWSVNLKSPESWVNRTKKITFLINASDVETIQNNLNLSIYYKSPFDTTWKEDFISNISYQLDHWEADFQPLKNAQIGEYSCKVICKDSDFAEVSIIKKIIVKNNNPNILSISTNISNNHIKRLESVKLLIYVSDEEILKKDLEVKIIHKHIQDLVWKNNFISKKSFINDHWEAIFTPDEIALLGSYIIRIICNDTYTEVYNEISIQVFNNKPMILGVTTSRPQINRTKPLKLFINASDIEVPEKDLNIRVIYKSEYDLDWQDIFIQNKIYIHDHWEFNFIADKHARVGKYIIRVICNDSYTEVFKEIEIFVKNNAPIIKELIISDLSVNRTEVIQIFVVVFDMETQDEDLDIKIKHKVSQDLHWNENYISNLEYSSGSWHALFSAPKTAIPGLYFLNITCSDEFSEITQSSEIIINNNIPAQPLVSILPLEPKNNDDLSLKIENIKDIETPEEKIILWSRWFRNDEYLRKFDNLTKIPFKETIKGDTWKCLIYCFDGIDLSLPGESHIVIVNSPPISVLDNYEIEIFEDSVTVIEEYLIDMFYDSDNDPLKYSVSNQKHISIQIIQNNGTIILAPPENWFGFENLIFMANDSFSKNTSVNVKVNVIPVNDLPIITQIGLIQLNNETTDEPLFITYQDASLNLDIHVKDFDGDNIRGLIEYTINKSESKNLKLIENTIRFDPKNSDVGIYYIKISVTDNNETPLEYISQDIIIKVINMNDPPTVRIIEPKNGTKYYVNKHINFSCLVEDVDLLITNSSETINYTWTSDVEGHLGYNSTPDVILLSPGKQQITIEVMDSNGLEAHDRVYILVEEIPINISNPKPKKSKSNDFYWLWILIIFLIIIIIFFLYFKKKQLKKDKNQKSLNS